MDIIKIPSSSFGSDGLYYNSSIIEYNGKVLMAYRWMYHDAKVVICETDLSFKEFRNHKEIAIPDILFKGEHAKEDPRLFTVNGKLYCSFINFCKKQVAQNQGLCALDEKLNVTQVWYLPYGDNINAACRLKQDHVCIQPGVYYQQPMPHFMEKNWTFFEHKKSLHCVYKLNPLDIFKVDLKKNSCKKVTANTPILYWNYGELRGGTPITKVGDKYCGFFHSVTFNKKHERVYHMGYYEFDERFKMTRISKKPILSGDTLSPVCGCHVVFPCGAIKKDDTWYISYGYNDMETHILKISQKEIDLF